MNKIHYILFQLETKGRGIDCEPKGSIWSTSIFKRDKSLMEQFCKDSKAEILKELKSYKEVQAWFAKWDKFVNKKEIKDMDVNTKDWLETARKFFK